MGSTGTAGGYIDNRSQLLDDVTSTLLRYNGYSDQPIDKSVLNGLDTDDFATLLQKQAQVGGKYATLGYDSKTDSFYSATNGNIALQGEDVTGQARQDLVTDIQNNPQTLQSLRQSIRDAVAARDSARAAAKKFLNPKEVADAVTKYQTAQNSRFARDSRSLVAQIINPKVVGVQSDANGWNYLVDYTYQYKDGTTSKAHSPATVRAKKYW